MKKKVITLIAALLVCTIFSPAKTQAEEKPYRLITVIYQVEPGDTLDSIASEYIKRNAYGQRDFGEFRQGIIELNYELLKTNDMKLAKGMNLRISYWVPSHPR